MHTLNADALDTTAIRAEFPVLKRLMRGRTLSYLDSGATSLKPYRVLEAERAYYEELSANIHRGVYEFSEVATARYDEARVKLAGLVNANRPHEVIFTRGTTESINLVGYAWGRKFLGPGDEILTSEFEHHSNIVVWQEVARATGAVLKFFPILPGAVGIDLDQMEHAFTDRTRVVAITGMSNVTGYKPPIARIVQLAHERNAVVLVDGAQMVCHEPVDVQSLGIDFLAFSGHKMCGPTGIGVLYAREELLEDMDPFLYGGDMIERVWKDRSTYARLPEKFEAGTPHIAGAIGLGEAVDFVQEVGLDAVAAHEEELLGYCLEKASAQDDLAVYGGFQASGRGGIFSFNLADVHAHDVGMILDSQGVAVRAGFHCAQPLMKLLGVAGTTRASFYMYTDRSDIDALFDGLDEVRKIFS